MAIPHGRWRGDDLCLELFDNGDFQISLLHRPPKTLVMGTVGQAREEGEGTIAVDFEVARIWQARFSSACRKSVRSGTFADSARVLGVEADAEATLSLRLRPKSKTELEVCGERCVTLTCDEPILGARWRIAGLENAGNPEITWREGALLEVDIEEGLGHVWVGKSETEIATVYGALKAKPLGGDRFELTFTREADRDLGDAGEVGLFGKPLEPGATEVLQARRLPKQRLEVCRGDDPCVTLERQFDSSDYNLR